MELRKTSLYEKHIENKGRVVDFAGWLLPVEYESMLKEAKATRSGCGMFDASHMGEIIIKGKNAFNFLQRLVSNDISLLRQGQMQYNLFLNEQGGVIDDLMVYYCQDSFLCVVNASNKDKVLNWLMLNVKKQAGVEIEDKSDVTALISVQGPAAAGIMSAVVNKEVSELEYMSFNYYFLDGCRALISRSGYTGEDGFEIYPSWNDAPLWWDAVLNKGRELGVLTCGLGSRDILRIEAGYPLYGHELDENIDPYSASLAWAVKLSKDSIGKESLGRIKEKGIVNKRVGFIMEERSVPRQGYPVYSENKLIGKVCSGTYSPNIDKFIGMAFVETDYAVVGTEIRIGIRNRFYKAKVKKWPFVKISAGKSDKLTDVAK